MSFRIFSDISHKRNLTAYAVIVKDASNKVFFQKTGIFPNTKSTHGELKAHLLGLRAVPTDQPVILHYDVTGFPALFSEGPDILHEKLEPTLSEIKKELSGRNCKFATAQGKAEYNECHETAQSTISAAVSLQLLEENFEKRPSTKAHKRKKKTSIEEYRFYRIQPSGQPDLLFQCLADSQAEANQAFFELKNYQYTDNPYMVCLPPLVPLTFAFRTRKPGTCRHFNGYQHGNCKAGISYHGLTDGSPGWGQKLPCRGTHLNETVVHAPCPNYSSPDPEEIEREDQKLQAQIETLRAIGPLLSEIKKSHQGKEWKGQAPCPQCQGKLSISQHKTGHTEIECSTPGCTIHWNDSHLTISP